MPSRNLRLRVDASDLAKESTRWRNAAKKSPEARRVLLERVGKDALRRVLGRYRDVPPVWYRLPVEYQGRFASGLRMTVRSGEKQAFMLLSADPDTVVADTGRRAGRKPPVDEIVQWAVDKLGLDPEEDRRQIAAIIGGIASRGTRGGHMFERAFSPATASGQQFDKFIDREIEYMADQILGVGKRR